MCACVSLPCLIFPGAAEGHSFQELIFGPHPASTHSKSQSGAGVKQQKDGDTFPLQERALDIAKELSVVAQHEVKSRHCDLLPTETDTFDFKAVVAVVVEVLGMNSCIPHDLRRHMVSPLVNS